MAKIDIFGVLALLGSVLAAVLLGGAMFAVCRGTPVLDIAAMIFAFLIVAVLLYLFFIGNDKGKSEDIVWITIGGSVGLIAYPIIYLTGTNTGIAEMIASAVLIALGAAGIGLLVRIRNDLRRF